MSRSQWFWLPPVVFGFVVAPPIIFFVLYVFGDSWSLPFAFGVGATATGLLTYWVGRWQRAPHPAAVSFAVLAAIWAVACGVQALRGVS